MPKGFGSKAVCLETTPLPMDFWSLEEKGSKWGWESCHSHWAHWRGGWDGTWRGFWGSEWLPQLPQVSVLLELWERRGSIWQDEQHLPERAGETGVSLIPGLTDQRTHLLPGGFLQTLDSLSRKRRLSVYPGFILPVCYKPHQTSPRQ